MPPEIATYFSFSEFKNGNRATVDEFRAALSQFNRLQTVYVCGVMNSTIHDWQGNVRHDVVEEFVKNSFPRPISSQIINALRSPVNPRGIYHRAQLLFVAKQALNLCPETGGNDPLAPAHSGDMARVFLMANDLLPKGLEGHLSSATQMIQVMSEFIPIGESSGFQKPINKIVRSRLMIDRFLTDNDGKIRKLFEKTTGVSLDDYFALCFATLCRYTDMDLTKFQADPALFILSPVWYRSTPIPEIVINSFLKEISATIADFNALFKHSSKAAVDFTCFRAKPFLRDEINHLLIDPVFLAEKSESGIFWSINHALPSKDRPQFHQDWGLAFERYVNWLLEESFDGKLNKLFPNPIFADNGEEVCDAVVLCGDSLMFLESKGATFTAEAKYGTDPEKLRVEIEEKFVETDGHRKGIGQLAARIEQVFNRSSPRRIEGIEVSRITKAFPILITRDDIGAAMVFNAYLASRFRDLFSRRAVSVVVTPPFCFSAQDIENLCGYFHDASFADLIEARYRAEASLFSSFWLVDNKVIERIGDRGCKPFKSAMHSYFESIRDHLFPGLDIPI